MNRSTFFASLVLAGLVTYIYFFERNRDNLSTGTAIFEITEDTVLRVELHGQVSRDGENHGSKQQITLEKEVTSTENNGADDTAWYLKEPVAALADDPNITQLLSDLASIESKRVVAQASQVDLKDYGLHEPLVEVKFVTEKSKKHGIAFGDKTPTGSHRYAKRSGDENILVVNPYVSDNFNKSAWDLRDKTVFRLEDSPTHTVSINTPKMALVLERLDNVWRITKPFSAIVEPYRAKTLLSRFKEAEWEAIVVESADDLSPYGLDVPSYRLSLEPEEGSISTLLIGKVGGNNDYYAKQLKQSQVFLLSKDLIEELSQEPTGLISKKLFHLSTFEVTGLHLKASDQQVRVLKRALETDSKEREWRQLSPGKSEVEQKLVQDLLYKLNGATAEEIVEAGTKSSHIYGLSKPAFTITVQSVSNEERLVVSKPIGDSVYCQRSGEDIALKLASLTWSGIEELLTLEPKTNP